ncbi:hypothetical protein CALCODRAFT_510524 [Calocera cornea HHB12733]|uniref:Uncharacterized protein n=1 Tax=Calocera cornea HHB12733 TaxID=1353952 RepID=A0A165EFX5_9BASI|nr:hypothetical protein CALCODRAFT_510524 [Calocera cornea HHB12733]
MASSGNHCQINNDHINERLTFGGRLEVSRPGSPQAEDQAEPGEGDDHPDQELEGGDREEDESAKDDGQDDGHGPEQQADGDGEQGAEHGEQAGVWWLVRRRAGRASGREREREGSAGERAASRAGRAGRSRWAGRAARSHGRACQRAHSLLAVVGAVRGVGCWAGAGGADGDEADEGAGCSGGEGGEDGASDGAIAIAVG